MEGILRWAGSKRRLLPTLVALIPASYSRYVEPFAGSACLFFELGSPRALLSDINSDLVNTFTLVKTAPRQLAQLIEGLPTSSEAYYTMRALEPTSLTDLQRAARFIYLNRLCFNGIYRTNRLGKFNVPYGGRRNGRLPTVVELDACSNALQTATLSCGDFESALAKVKKDDFVYMDPPYSVRSRRVFKQYDGATFGDFDIQRLQARMRRLHDVGAKFLVSYAESKEGRTLAEGFNVRSSYVQRSIAGFFGDRRKAKELLITNY